MDRVELTGRYTLDPGQVPSGRRSRRDRRGRGLRGPLLPSTAPARRSRSERFDALVTASLHRLSTRWPDELAGVDVAVEDIPPNDPTPWEEGHAPLGRVYPSDGQRAPRLVVYRRPVEIRSDDDLPLLVHEVVVEQVAVLLGRSPEEIDPAFGA